MRQIQDGYEFFPSETSQQSAKQGSVHNSHREYTFAPYNSNENQKLSLNDSKTNSKYHNSIPATNHNKKKSASQPSNYLSMLKQQYAPQHSTQSTNHSQTNYPTKNGADQFLSAHTYEERRLSSNKEKDLYFEMQQQKQYFENELTKYQSIIRNLENDLKLSKQLTEYMKQYQDQNEILSKSIEDAIKKLNIANTSINQLEQEKESLLDYIEVQKQIAEQLKRENDQCSNSGKDNKHLVSQLKAQIDTYNKELIEKEELLKQLSQNSRQNNLEDEIMKYQLQIAELQTKLMDYEMVNKDLSRKFNDSVSQIQLYIRQSDEKPSHFQFTQNQDNHSICEFESNLKSSRNTNIICKQQQGLDQMMKKNQQTLKDFQSQLQLHQQLGQFQEKITNQLLQIEQLNSQLLSQQSQQNQLLSQNQAYQQQQAKLNKQIFELTSTAEKLQQERQQQIEEIEQLQQQLAEQNNINQDLNTKYFEQRKGISDLQQYQSQFESLQMKGQEDVEYYEKVISDFNQSINKIQRKIDDIIVNLRQEPYPTFQPVDCSTQSILYSIEILETLILKGSKFNLSNYTNNNTQLNFTTNQTPTNLGSQSKPFTNEYFESNQKVSIISNYTNYSKPYLVKRNYYL